MLIQFCIHLLIILHSIINLYNAQGYDKGFWHSLHLVCQGCSNPHQQLATCRLPVTQPYSGCSNITQSRSIWRHSICKFFLTYFIVINRSTFNQGLSVILKIFSKIFNHYMPEGLERYMESMLSQAERYLDVIFTYLLFNSHKSRSS